MPIFDSSSHSSLLKTHDAAVGIFFNHGHVRKNVDFATDARNMEPHMKKLWEGLELLCHWNTVMNFVLAVYLHICQIFFLYKNQSTPQKYHCISMHWPQHRCQKKKNNAAKLGFCVGRKNSSSSCHSDGACNITKLQLFLCFHSCASNSSKNALSCFSTS